MTAPVWMASPPELHAALLSSGPGPGPLLAAAASWSSLSVEYASVADELGALVATVDTGAWQGPSGERYAAAHGPYLAWLTQASADSATAAAQQQTVAGAYGTALAAMPTLPELAANHTVHGVLSATNFFGINTIPIALNEADYARMWIQAATTMGTYQAVADSAAAATPHIPAAPSIVNSEAAAGDDHGDDGDHDDHDHAVNSPFDQFLANLLRSVSNGQIDWDPAHATLNGIAYDDYVDPSQPLFWLVRSLELLEDFQQFGIYLQQNPALAFEYLVQLMEFDWPTHIAEIVTWLSQSPQLLSVALTLTVAPVAAVPGLAGLAGLAAIQPVAPVIAVPPSVEPTVLPAAAGTTPTIGGTAAAPTPGPSPAPAGSTAAAPAPPPPGPPPVGGAGLLPPFLVGPPGIGSGAGLGARASAGAKKTASAPDHTAAAAAAAAREQARARRRRRAAQHETGHKFMDMDVDVVPDWAAPTSDRGAGPLGFAGTAPAPAVAAGLTTLTRDRFDADPRVPLLPDTWVGR